jgi:hypothetical protein
MCPTLRPAGAIVHDQARGEGAHYSASAASAVASLPAGSASADGERRRYIRRPEEPGEGWGAEWGAECTWISPASYAARFPYCSAYCFGVSLHARGWCGFGSAVRRSAAVPVDGLDGPVGAAHEQLGDGVGFATARGIVQRREPARQTAEGARPPHSADRRKRKRRTRRRPGRSRRRRMRRAIGRFGDCRRSPPSVARWSHNRCARTEPG